MLHVKRSLATLALVAGLLVATAPAGAADISKFNVPDVTVIPNLVAPPAGH